MQVSQISITKFLKTANSLSIPVYQRDYAWKIQNCKKLWEDIQQLILNKKDNHFLGTLVTVNNGLGKYLVIDGQQRLTTVTLFLLALSNYIKHKDDKNEEGEQLLKIFNSYLIDDESISKDIRIKLKPNKSDFEYFKSLFKNDNFILEGNSNIINNYLYFLEQFKNGQISARSIFEEGLQKLEIVSIDLIRGQDDPQLIFESLNSTE